jgi:hypothetical protein
MDRANRIYVYNQQCIKTAEMVCGQDGTVLVHLKSWPHQVWAVWIERACRAKDRFNLFHSRHARRISLGHL